MHTFRLRLVGPVLAAAALGFIPASAAQAAAPANDNFADAATLTEVAGPQAATAYDNVDATIEAGEPNPANAGKASDCSTYTARPDCGASVWFTFTPSTTGNYTIQTCDQGTDSDTVLGVYTGAAVGSLTSVATNDDGSGTCFGGSSAYGSRVTFAATQGTPYRVTVGGYSAGEGLFFLSAYPGAAAANPTNDTRMESGTSAAALAAQRGSDVRSGPRNSATFAFGGLDASATFECALDGAAFSVCSTPVEYDGLAVDGAPHTFRVRAVVGGVPDPTPAEQRFRLDNTAPDTAFSVGPAEGATVPNPVVFTWASTEHNPQRSFRCSEDGVDFIGCSSSFSENAFCNGAHTVTTAAIDPALNLDASAASRGFTVSGGTACAPPTVGVPTATSLGATTATLQTPLTTGGTAQNVRFRWGTTTAYGGTASLPVSAGGTSQGVFVQGLVPATTYHYDVTVSGPNGTVSTGDQTFTTTALAGGQVLPALSVGTPVIVGQRAVRIPVSTDVGAPASGASIATYVSADGPPAVTDGAVTVPSIPSSAVGPQARTVSITDLKPATTYHYRVVVQADESVASEDRTFTTASPPAPPAPPTTTTTTTTVTTPPFVPPVIKPVAFKLTSRLFKFSALKRTSRKITIKVKGVPASTKLTLTVKGRKTLLSAKKTASRTGTATFTLKLGAKVRRALKVKSLKAVKFVFKATPPAQKKSSLTITKRLPN
jgi:hypothetical protein